MYRIGVLSDTHIPRRKPIPKVVLEALRGMELIVHAGDITDQAVLDQLSSIAPVEAVAGNIDPESLRDKLGRKKLLHVAGKVIGLVHGDEGNGRDTPERAYLAFREEGADCVVFGHSHIPYSKRREGVLLFNPGSITDPRRQPLPSFGIIELGREVTGKIMYFDGNKLIH